MNIFEKESISEELLIIRKNFIGQSTTEQLYRHSRPSVSSSLSLNALEEPQLAMYELLRSLVRRQLRHPFQTLRQSLRLPSPANPSPALHHYLRRDLEVAAENLRNVCKLVRQRLIVEGFLEVKSAYLRRNRVEGAYFSAENLARLNMSMVLAQNAQRIYLKWEGFSRLFENLRGMKLSKITLSKIEVVSSDLTAKEFEDFNPFLADRGREIEAVNSYIIDRSSEAGQEGARQLEESLELKDEVREIRQPASDQQQQSIERHFFSREGTHTRTKERQVTTREKHASLTEKFFTAREKGEGEGGVECGEFVAETVEKKQLKKTVTAYYGGRELRESDELEQKVLITHRKEASSGRPLPETAEHHLFLIRDYRAKATAPSNYVKIPLAADDVKIVEIHTARKKTGRKRVVREESEVEREICENCKFCVQMRERSEIMRTVQQRFSAARTASDSLAVQSDSLAVQTK